MPRTEVMFRRCLLPGVEYGMVAENGGEGYVSAGQSAALRFDATGRLSRLRDSRAELTSFLLDVINFRRR